MPDFAAVVATRDAFDLAEAVLGLLVIEGDGALPGEAGTQSETAVLASRRQLSACLLVRCRASEALSLRSEHVQRLVVELVDRRGVSDKTAFELLDALLESFGVLQVDILAVGRHVRAVAVVDVAAVVVEPFFEVDVLIVEPFFEPFFE
ncbi:MAG: hypothetical protein GY704_03840, partial [Phycisphaeraceae bacterium]|nr:hypothetical protein [Phycisphaeraceae bacterium]